MGRGTASPYATTHSEAAPKASPLANHSKAAGPVATGGGPAAAGGGGWTDTLFKGASLLGGPLISPALPMAQKLFSMWGENKATNAVGPGSTPTPAPAPGVTPQGPVAPVPAPAPTPGTASTTPPAPAQIKASPEQLKHADEVRKSLDEKMGKMGDLTPAQRALIDGRVKGLSGDALVSEMATIERSLSGPNADRALATYSDLSKMAAVDPKAKARISPEVVAMLVTGVGDRRTASDRGQEGILGGRQARDSAQGLVNMSDEDYQKTMQVLSLAGTDKDGKPVAGADRNAEQSLILKSVAARRDQVKPETIFDKIGSIFGMESQNKKANQDISQFATDIRGMKRDDLIRQTTLLDVDDQNTSTVDPNNIAANNDTKVDNDGLFQRFTTTCGPTTAQMVRGEADPIYALKVHREGINNPDPTTQTAKEQKKVLEDNGGVAVSRLGSQARSNVNGQLDQLASAGKLTVDQRASLERYLTGQAGNNIAQAITAGTTLAQLRATNGGHPNDQEIAAMRADGNKSAAGMGLEPALDTVSQPGTHIDYQTEGVGPGGVASKLSTADALLKDGQDVPFRLANSGGHFMMLSDVRTDASGNKKYLMSDPWTGGTRWVSSSDLTSGNFSQPGGAFSEVGTGTISHIYTETPKSD